MLFIIYLFGIYLLIIYSFSTLRSCLWFVVGGLPGTRFGGGEGSGETAGVRQHTPRGTTSIKPNMGRLESGSGIQQPTKYSQGLFPDGIGF